MLTSKESYFQFNRLSQRMVLAEFLFEEFIQVHSFLPSL